MRALGMVVVLVSLARPVLAQDGKRPPPKSPKPAPVITIGPLDVVGTLRNAMMMTFLERASEELERANLERRSFVDRIVLSVDDEQL